MIRRTRRGATLTEVVIAASLSVLVLSGAVSVLILGLQNWATGQGMIDSEGSSQRAMRTVANRLKEAMAVNVSADGRRIDYRLPARDAGGDFTIPVVWDGIDRSFYIDSGNLVMADGGTTRIVARRVRRTDWGQPWSHPSNRMFTAEAAARVRAVTIRIRTSNFSRYNRRERATARETVYIRNMPDLIR